MRIDASLMSPLSYVILITVLVLGCNGESDSSALADTEPVEPAEAVNTEVATTVPTTEINAESAVETAEAEPVEEKSLSRIDWSRDRPSGAFDREYLGRFLLTYVELGPLNGRTDPSLDAAVATQLGTGDPVVVTGVTPFTETINGQTAPWVRIEYGANAEELVSNSGFGRSTWVFAAYLSDSPDASAPITPTVHSSDVVFPQTVTLHLGDRSQRIRLAHTGSQRFGVFVRDPGAAGFRYTETPGTYIWNRDTNRVRHMGYFGSIIEREPSKFTNDLQYRIDGFGTGVTGRTYTVSDLATDRVVARISGAQGFSFDGQTLEVSVTKGPQLDPHIPGTREIQGIAARCLEHSAKNDNSNVEKVVRLRYTFGTGDVSLVNCTEQIRE